MSGIRKSSMVWTNGCFDVLSAAHCRFLRACRDMGGCLIVGLNSDESVKRLKGPTRPINPYDLRKEVLESLGCCVYGRWISEIVKIEDTPTEVLNVIRPCVVVKGKGYVPETMPEYETVVGYGGRVVFLQPFYNELSSTQIIKKACNEVVLPE